MECVKSALKKSFRGETNHQGGNDDVFMLNVQSADDFFVDDLLNFSNDDGEEEEHGEEPGKPRNDVVHDSDKKNDTFVSAFDHAATELTVPADELANLEWLSHFVEDSFSEFTTTPFLSPANPKTTEISTFIEVKPPCFSSPIPAKARTKRSRTGGRVWSTLTESTSSSSSSSSSSTVQSRDPSGSVEKPAKKQRRKPCGESAPTPARRCSHCGVQKTPQWRTGPNGAKTLCNACGVRFKSGRLLPEYRPACSPTFSSELHSNHHRKVLEMRRKKDDGPVFLPRTGSGPPVLSGF